MERAWLPAVVNDDEFSGPPAEDELAPRNGPPDRESAMADGAMNKPIADRARITPLILRTSFITITFFILLPSF